MRVAGTSFGLVGALAAFPRRLAAREIAGQGGSLRRGVTRRTDCAVFGHGALQRYDDQAIEIRRNEAIAAGASVLSENGLMRLLGIAGRPANASMMREALLAQSGLDPDIFALLALFDAFEHDNEPFSFRDVILARKYAGLVAAGAGWGAIARSVHQSGSVASLTALSLATDGADGVFARLGSHLAELDGQALLPIEEPDDTALEEFFEAAAEAEGQGRLAEAAALYARCLALDPGDAVAAFNRANCLAALGETGEAGLGYMRALKIDPGFIEAWFNHAGLLRAHGQVEAARKALEKAIALDPEYADAVYNLATLEYEAGDLAAARRWWQRYLELDDRSDWARLAARGIRLAELELRQSAG